MAMHRKCGAKRSRTDMGIFSIAIQATSGHTEKWNGPQFSHMLQIAFIINDQHFNFCTLIVAIKPNDILFGCTMEHIPEVNSFSAHSVLRWRTVFIYSHRKLMFSSYQVYSQHKCNSFSCLA